MPKVVREDINALNVVLTITIAKEDYEPKFKKELSKIKDKAAIKGFRKGKTPTGFLKKMYGKGILSEIVSEMLQHELSGELANEAVSYLGRPIPTEDHQPVDFDLNSLEDYTFKFDIGKAPDFEIKGVDKSSEFEVFQIELPEEKVLERLEYFRKRRGNRVETDDTIADEDMITFSATEMEGEELKPDGWKTTFSILFDRIVEGNVKNELRSKKKGDIIRFNIFELEEGTQPEYVKKYLLNFTEADLEEGTETSEMYEATIESVQRMVPAELNQEFFDNVFEEGTVTNEEEAKAELKKSLLAQFQGKINAMLYREMRMRLMELNKDNMPLPDDFIKRWLKIDNETQANKILKDYEGFADDMRWNLIKNKLYKKYDFEVTEEDVKNTAYHKVASYFGGYHYDEKFMEPIVKRILEDREQVNSLVSEVLTDRLFHALKVEVTLKEVPISEEDFNKKYQDVLDEEERKARLNEEVPDMEVELEEEE